MIFSIVRDRNVRAWWTHSTGALLCGFLIVVHFRLITKSCHSWIKSFLNSEPLSKTTLEGLGYLDSHTLSKRRLILADTCQWLVYFLSWYHQYHNKGLLRSRTIRLLDLWMSYKWVEAPLANSCSIPKYCSYRSINHHGIMASWPWNQYIAVRPNQVALHIVRFWN